MTTFRHISIGSVKMGNDLPLVLIAMPFQIEDCEREKEKSGMIGAA